MAASSAGRLMARTTILATGLQDRHPPIDGWERDGGYAGPIRFCPICDGYAKGGHDDCSNAVAGVIS